MALQHIASFALLTLVLSSSIWIFKLQLPHFWISEPLKNGNNNNNINNTLCVQQVSAFSIAKFDGVGAQAQSIASAIAYYHQHSHVVDFYYTPIHDNKQHGSVGQIMDKFLNLGLNEKKLNESNKQNVTYLKKIRAVDENPSYYYDSQRLQIFHENYMLNKEYYNISYIQTAHNFNIAVHIRRGDIIKRNETTRFMSNLNYIQIMKDILNQIELNQIERNQKQRITFNIFSEYNFDKNDFSEKAQTYLYVGSQTRFDIKYFIDAELKDTIHALVTSDALIMSKSSFSYLAALLSKSKYIYYTEFWHKPLNKWNVVQNTNNIHPLKTWWTQHKCGQDNIAYVGNITIFRNIHCHAIWKDIEKGLCLTMVKQQLKGF